jgi:large subunit ribosomal protein L6
VKGPKGQLELDLRPEVAVAVQGKQVVVSQSGKGPARQASAFHGMTRALLSNMVEGVTKGFEKTLEIQGIGWNAAAQGRRITLNIGFCHQVHVDLPAGINAATPNPTTIVLSGIDSQAVGQLAAQIRAIRPPEPYKGKGIRYRGEVVRRKAGKTFGK